jgi:hypothetical protein
MNCSQFQDSVFEYVEESLPCMTRAAADAHLLSCAACRRLLDQQRQFARCFSDRCERDTEGLALRSEVRRRTEAAIPGPSGARVHGSPVADRWRRLFWPATIGAAIVLGACLITGFPFRSRMPAMLKAPSLEGNSDAAVLIRLSDCVPTYTFRREGDLVIDSLTCNPRVVEQTLWLTQNQKAAKQRRTPL